MPSQIQSHECGIHHLTYVSTRPGCPLCEADRTIDGLKVDVSQLRQENRYLKEQLEAAQIQTDSVVGYRKAATLLDDDDRAFVKQVLYMIRDEASVALKPLKADRDVEGGLRRIAVGFIVHPRQGNAWTYECTSLGGLFLASMYDEACNAMGQSQATKNMVRGLAELLPGSARR